MTEPLPFEVVHEIGAMYAEDREWKEAVSFERARELGHELPPDQLPDIDLRGPLTELVCEFVVHGDPVGQGRVSFRGKGRGAFHSNEHILNPWRAEIGRAFARWVIEQGQLSPWEALTGPLQVDRFYTVQKPATKKSQRPWPIVTSAKNSDIDHYDRAVFDGLSKCGAIQDDALIIGGAHWKAYPNTHPLCPPEPGVHIWIYTVGDPQ